VAEAVQARSQGSSGDQETERNETKATKTIELLKSISRTSGGIQTKIQQNFDHVCDCRVKSSVKGVCKGNGMLAEMIIVLLLVANLVQAFCQPLCGLIDRVRLKTILRGYVHDREEKERVRIEKENEYKEFVENERARVERERVERKMRMNVVV